MAVRGRPQPSAPARASAPQAGSQDLAGALRSAGLLRAGGQLQEISKAIINNMKSAGFDGSGGRGLEGQLSKALGQFQHANGLPTTGRLDAATLGALKEQGLLPAPGGQARGAEAGAQRGAEASGRVGRDGYEQAQHNKLLPQQARVMPRSEGQKGQGESLLSFLTNLLKGTLGGTGKAKAEAAPNPGGGGEQGADAGAAARGGGEPARPQAAQQQPRADTRSQRAEPRQQQPENRPSRQEPQQPAQAGRGAAQAGGAARAAASAGPPAAQPRAEGAPTQAAPQAGPAASQSTATDQQRASTTTALQDPSVKGLPQEQGELEAEEGHGKKVGERRGRDGGEGEDGAPQEAGGEDGSGLEEEADASERDSGNASSGDELAAQAERGHASLDDGSDAEAGYYEIPPLSQQIEEALAGIRREAERAHRTTTYSWDLTLYRPAIYGAGQKAQELFHLVVDSATAFDEVWERARTEINRHLRRHEPDASALELEQISRALQRARVAEKE